MLVPPLRIMLFRTSARTELLTEFTRDIAGGQISSFANGGFGTCTIMVPLLRRFIWLAMKRENLPGYHFYHLLISADRRVVWEGRVLNVQDSLSQSMLTLQCAGYWSSLRDEYYDDQDGGNTDWAAAGSPVRGSTIFKEMLTKSCPSISSDQSAIETDALDFAGSTEFHDRDYPQNHLVDHMTGRGDSNGDVWEAGIGEGLRPYWRKREISSPVDWVVWLKDLAGGSVSQQGQHVRNLILPVKGSTEGTAASDTESQLLYPERHLQLTIPEGVSTAQENLMRDAALVLKADPAQDQSLVIKGQIYTARVAPHMAAATGALRSWPKYFVRGGTSIRIADLLPSATAGTSFDGLRTYYIEETTYNLMTNELSIVPDRPLGSLPSILAGQFQAEPVK